MNKITYLRKAAIISTCILWYPMAEYIYESAFIWIHHINNDCKKRVNTWGSRRKCTIWRERWLSDWFICSYWLSLHYKSQLKSLSVSKMCAWKPQTRVQWLTREDINQPKCCFPSLKKSPPSVPESLSLPSLERRKFALSKTGFVWPTWLQRY